MEPRPQNTIGPVMFKVIEETAKSTEIKVQQERRQKNEKITTPIKEKGTDKSIYITSTPGNAEKMSGNTKLKELAKSAKSTEIHTDPDQVEPTATSPIENRNQIYPGTRHSDTTSYR